MQKNKNSPLDKVIIIRYNIIADWIICKRRKGE